MHSAGDRIALPAQSEALVREPDHQRKDDESVPYPGEGHGFRRIATNVDYVRRMDRFLCQKVPRAPEPGPLEPPPYPPAAAS